MSSKLNKALIKILIPIAKFCLKHTLSYQQAETSLREAFLEATKSELQKNSEKITVSSLSIRTGLPRREIKRILEGSDKPDMNRSIISRIIGQWQSDRKFSDQNGPRELTYQDSASEFYQLCSLITKDVPAGSILNDLLSRGYVTESNNYLRLTVGAHEIKGDLVQALESLSVQIDNLLTVVTDNTSISGNQESKHHHAITFYDRIRADKSDEIKAWLYREGSRFHELIRCFLAPYDLDVNPDLKYKGDTLSVNFSSFSLTEDNPVIKNNP